LFRSARRHARRGFRRKSRKTECGAKQFLAGQVVCAAPFALPTFAIAGAEAPSTAVQFSTHPIADQLRGGYSVAIADIVAISATQAV
jgi:hypothetical protein